VGAGVSYFQAVPHSTHFLAIHQNCYLIVPSSLWHPWLLLQVSRSWLWGSGFVSRFSDGNFLFQLISLMGWRSHWFSICSAFSCEDRNDNSQTLYMVELKSSSAFILCLYLIFWYILLFSTFLQLLALNVLLMYWWILSFLVQSKSLLICGFR
jgi:hypothetical protein